MTEPHSSWFLVMEWLLELYQRAIEQVSIIIKNKKEVKYEHKPDYEQNR